jgi:peptidoglycan/xylan/chitin deacetylase (PgdA/CDA1 family)
MADQPGVIGAGAICDKSLSQAYSLITRLLDAHALKATCAFVSAFAAGAEALRANQPLLRELASKSPEWFSQVLPSIERGQVDGWFGDRFYATLRAAGHEMAWHGATHLCLADQTSADAVELELQLATSLFDAIGDTPETIVFPRNLVGHLDRLQHAGFQTYRAHPPSGFAARLLGLAHEWNILDSRVQAKPLMQQGWQVSPAGFFLNWPSGVRACVPVEVTVRRWKSLLRAAVEQGGYIHMWFHPHNLITAPAMQVAFEQIMSEVGQLVRTGDMGSLTMSEANVYFELGRERKMI